MRIRRIHDNIEPGARIKLSNHLILSHEGETFNVENLSW